MPNPTPGPQNQPGPQPPRAQPAPITPKKPSEPPRQTPTPAKAAVGTPVSVDRKEQIADIERTHAQRLSQTPEFRKVVPVAGEKRQLDARGIDAKGGQRSIEMADIQKRDATEKTVRNVVSKKLQKIHDQSLANGPTTQPASDLSVNMDRSGLNLAQGRSGLKQALDGWSRSGQGLPLEHVHLLAADQTSGKKQSDHLDRAAMNAISPGLKFMDRTKSQQEIVRREPGPGSVREKGMDQSQKRSGPKRSR